jgi:hypothetical protein
MWPEDAIPEGLSWDSDNPKYRRFKGVDGILEYTLDGDEITVDWVSGRNAASMMKVVLDADGKGVTKISGYVTDKLADASQPALLRLGDLVAGRLGGLWTVSTQPIEGRRFLVFTKRELT